MYSTNRSTYEILDRIGEGAQAIVYRARASDGHLVAIKTYRYTTGDDGRSRFVREVGLLRRLPPHVNIVTLEDEQLEGDLPFAVLRYVEGVSLARIDRPQEWRSAGHLLLGIANGLDHAHTNGVLHRDLKPENVVVMRDNTPVIVDFGAGKHVSDDTITGSVFGTMSYMAPEQLRADCPLTGAVDVHALGLIAVRHLLRRDPCDLGDLPPALHELLTLMIAEDAADRPTAPQVCRALAGLLSGTYGHRYTLHTLLSVDGILPSRERENSHREVGRRLLSRYSPADVPAALGALREAVAETPEDAEAMGLLALALHEGYYFGVGGVTDQDLQDAFSLASTAASHETAGADGVLSLAKLGWHTGRHEAAVLATIEALSRTPSDSAIQKAFATACVYAGIGEHVLSLLASLVERTPTDGDALYRYGEALQLAGEYPQALAIFRRYRDVYPMSGVGYEMDAMCRLATADVAGAEQILTEQLERTRDVNRLLYGDVAARGSRPIEAGRRWLAGVEEFEHIPESSLRGRQLLWKAMFAARLGMREVAVGAREAALFRDPTNSYSLMRSATVEAMLGNPESAARYIEAAADNGFTNAALLRLEEAFYFRDASGEPSYVSARDHMEQAAARLLTTVKSQRP